MNTMPPMRRAGRSAASARAQSPLADRAWTLTITGQKLVPPKIPVEESTILKKRWRQWRRRSRPFGNSSRKSTTVTRSKTTPNARRPFTKDIHKPESNGDRRRCPDSKESAAKGFRVTIGVESAIARRANRSQTIMAAIRHQNVRGNQRIAQTAGLSARPGNQASRASAAGRTAQWQDARHTSEPAAIPNSAMAD